MFRFTCQTQFSGSCSVSGSCRVQPTTRLAHQCIYVTNEDDIPYGLRQMQIVLESYLYMGSSWPPSPIK
ncbi:hypothetical protein Hanom_Chr01g00091961 [Helianthus anomalus]